MPEPTYEELKARLEELEKQKSRGRSGSLEFRVSEKGGVSVYGLGRFPVTLYYEQWVRLLEAADKLAKEGVSAEVIDPRTLVPLDKRTIVESVKKTSRAIVIDEGYEQYGVTAELASVIADEAFYYLDAPVKRMGAMNVPIPFSPVLEDLTIPNHGRNPCRMLDVFHRIRLQEDEIRQFPWSNGADGILDAE